jgi:hypothetical protein
MGDVDVHTTLQGDSEIEQANMLLHWRKQLFVEPLVYRLGHRFTDDRGGFSSSLRSDRVSKICLDSLWNCFINKILAGK